MKFKFKNNVNRIVCYVLTIIILLSSLGTSLIIFANTSADTWKGSETAPTVGTGDISDPYLISTPEELAYAVKFGGLGKYYKLTTDIYLNDVSKIDWATGAADDGYTPKEWYKEVDTVAFSGSIDGDGHIVYGLYSTGTTDNAGYGLIPHVDEQKTIKIVNLGIDKAYISGTGAWVSAFVGRFKNNGTISYEKCFAGANVTLKGNDVGVFYGYGNANYNIKNCYSLATISATACNGLIGNCWASLNAVANVYAVGVSITSKWDGRPSVSASYTSVYSYDGIQLSVSNMMGMDALTAENKMPNLGNAFKATASYPILKIFASSVSDENNESEDTNSSFLWDGTTKQPSIGNGEDNDPFQISNAEELAFVIKNGGDGKNYKLTADIYLNNIDKLNWKTGTADNGYVATPWYDESVIVPFSGNIDGDGHVIYGLFATSAASNVGCGLIPSIADQAAVTIKNLGVDAAYLKASDGYVSAFVAKNKNSGTLIIENCYTGADVSLTGKVAGVFFGYGDVSYKISKSYSLATLSGSSHYGIVGECWSGSNAIDDLYAVGIPATTKWDGRPTANNAYFSVWSSVGTQIDADKMQGQDALTNSNKMYLLASCGSFEPTSSYPVLRVFGKHTVPANANSWDGTVVEPQGEGTENNPVLITNPQELAYVIKNGGNDKYYKLSTDVYLNDINKTNYLTGESEKNHTPQSWYTNADVTPFKGTIDGDGHIIYGLFATSTASNVGCGLIPSIADQATVTIKNLGIDFAYLKASDSYVSAFVAKNKNSGKLIIENCYAGTDVSLTGKVTGVFFGYGDVSYNISKSYSLATLSGSSHYGIVGECWGGPNEINDLYAVGIPATTKWDGRPTTSNAYFSVSSFVGTQISEDKMKGLDVLSEYTKMPLLEDCEAFEPTDSYPILKVFSTSSVEEEAEVAEGKIWSGKVAKKFASGTGTESDPYIITNGAELAYAVKKKGFNGSFFKLTNDIYLNDVSNINWAGNAKNNEWIVNSAFNGHLDGDGHIVYGIWFPDDNEAESAGLISVFNSGSIKNIGIRYSQIRATVNAGSIVGITDRGGLKIVDKCFSDETVTVGYTTTQNGGASGIIGQAGYEQADDLTLKISNCYSKAKLSGHSDQRVNGIIGTSWVSYYTMENCYSITYSPYTAQNKQTCSNMHKNGMELNEIYKNIYTDLRTPNEWENFTLVNIENMIGESAKKHMSGLDYVNVFETVASSTPKLKIFRTYTGEDVDISGDSEVYESGSGKKSDPFIIANAEQLRYLLQSDNTKGKYYELSHDIYLNDVSRSNWTLSNPKEWYSNSNSQMFEGYIDGKGHYIYGLYMNEEPSPYKDGIAWETSTTALFPMVSTAAVIRNIHIRKSYISGKGKVASIIGEILNTDNGLYTQVIACSADDTVVLKGQVVGGIALGWASRGLKLHYSYFTGKISSTDKERGNALVADIWGYDWELVQCYFVGYPAYRSSITPSVISGNYGSYNMGNIKYLTVEQMTGLNARHNMVDFEWDTVWKTVDNDTPHLKVVPADKNVKVYDEGVKGRVWSGYRAKDYASGGGTENDPYIIETPEQMLKLVAFDTNTKEKHYKLVADLKLNDTSSPNWEKSAREWLSGSNSFYGHFDGNGHVVSGIYFDTSFTEVGLFQRVSSGAVIEKLGVTKSTIKSFGDDKNGSYAAAITPLIGWDVSEDEFVPPLISQCFADHTVYIEAYYAGGLIGGISRWINVENCYFTGEVNGEYWSGQCMANIWNLTPSSVSNSYFASADGSPLATHTGAKVIKIENVYHRGINFEVSGCVSIATMLIRGQKAKEYMPNLDYEKIWKTVEGGTPVLRCFNNAEKYSDTTMPEKVEISFATQGGSQCEPIYGYPSYTNFLVKDLPVPTKYGYEFEGWYYFSGGYVPVKDSLFPEYSTVFHAKWKPISIIIDFEEDVDSKYDINSAAEQFKPGVSGYLTTYVHGGLKSMHIIEQSEIDPLFLLSYKSQLDVGSEYEMTIRMSTDSSEPVDGTIELLHANHPQIDSDILGYEKAYEFSDLTRGKWVEYKVTFTANSPYLLMKPLKGTSLFFDDIQIVPTGKKGDLGKIEAMTYDSSNSNLTLFILLGIASLAVLSTVSTIVFFVMRKKKQQIN